MTSGIVVRPLRFSADVEAMRGFLELLGLRSRIESERGGWIDMVAGAGLVALHDSATSDMGASAGQTVLSFETEDVDELAERLRQAGYDDATVWDEAYGRVLRVDAPAGVSVWIDERSDDLYGYRLHKAEPDERWSVRPLLTTNDPDGWRKLLNHLDTGLVEVASGMAYDVQLGLGTTEGLDVVAARLADAVVERRDGRLVVRDPDGCLVTVFG